MADYVNNQELMNTLVEFCRYNLEDDLMWSIKTSNRKKQGIDDLEDSLEDDIDDEQAEIINSKIEKGQNSLDSFTKYIEYAREMKNDTRAKLASGELTKVQLDTKMDDINHRLYSYVQEMTYRRTRQLGLYRHFDFEETHDVITNIMLYVIRYVNRYNLLGGTSAFAYITQMINNAYKLARGKREKRRYREIQGLDFIESGDKIPHKVCTTNISDRKKNDWN